MTGINRKSLTSWSARQAVGILAVDNIKLSAFGLDLLKRKEDGLISYDQAREEIRLRAKALAAKG
ncbi:hypothetical protein FNU76_07405 [Chitinimonas arctica]|uniref:Antitoxin VbhA domain-containing protein n=1 Tax=Chitinimonas arctica TaxID=2594795 RepID=A0A516SDG4_9NEIS|nr:hypothetical protein [Chitinimonas arctica]QDQ26197.1 hypothetical protein FNU76_07405 [Chitinimonas arctica]